MPAFAMMLGLTKMMYPIVMNVVIPAMISVRTELPASLILKSDSNIRKDLQTLT